ncbi:MAG: FaeA/PapI family transcriptional regulator [archaeon]
MNNKTEDNAVTNDADAPVTADLVGRIAEYIKKNEHGVSIQQVAKEFEMSRYQTNYYLGMLIGLGKVGVKQIGPVKVHYYKRR